MASVSRGREVRVARAVCPARPGFGPASTRRTRRARRARRRTFRPGRPSRRADARPQGAHSAQGGEFQRGTAYRSRQPVLNWSRGSVFVA